MKKIIEYINEHPFVKFMAGTVSGTLSIIPIQKVSNVLYNTEKMSNGYLAIIVFILVFGCVFGILELSTYLNRKKMYLIDQIDLYTLLISKILIRKSNFKKQFPDKQFMWQGFEGDEQLLHNKLNVEFIKNIGLIINKLND